MARARNIKPGFFRNADLVEFSYETRLLFIGLWTLADREGRLEDRPKQIKMDIFPADSVDCDSCLKNLAEVGMVSRYEVEGKRYIQIENFTKHQNPHHMEAPSEIPPKPGTENRYNSTPISPKQRARIYSRDGYACKLCGSPENLQIDHIQLVCNGGTSDDDNLRTLCSQCNNKRSKSNKPEANLADSLIPDSLNLIPDSKPSAQETRLALSLELFDSFWQEYPKRPGASKANSLKAWNAREKEGIDPQTIIDGVRRYAAYCQASGTEPKFIKQPETFLGPGHHFESDWTAPAQRASPAYQSIHDKRAETIAILTGKKPNERTIANEHDITGESVRVA